MPGVFVDTSGFFAILAADDRNHAHAMRFLRGTVASHEPLVSSNFIIAETHALLLARRHRTAAFAFLRGIEAMAVKFERVSEGDETEARAILERYQDKDFSYTDATSFAIMGRRSITRALTFDRDFMQFGVEQA